ncbi:MAG: hypothetical protein ACXWZ2_13605 [Mycobacterium sp.]
MLPRSEWPGLKYARENLRGSCEHCNRKRGAGRKQARQQPPPKALSFFDPPKREANGRLSFGT